MPDLDPVTVWVLIAIASATIEVLATHFVLIFVSAGAIVAAIVAGFSASVVVQMAAFSIAVAASFTLRTQLMARFQDSPGVPSGTDRLIGHEALVTHDIDPAIGGGRVVVRGQDWAAHSPVAIPSGERVRVVAVDGIVLEVARNAPNSTASR